MNTFKCGIDIGSTTIKVTVIDEDKIKYSVEVKDKKVDEASSKEVKTRIDTLKLFIDKSKTFKENKTS